MVEFVARIVDLGSRKAGVDLVEGQGKIRNWARSSEDIEFVRENRAAEEACS